MATFDERLCNHLGLIPRHWRSDRRDNMQRTQSRRERARAPLSQLATRKNWQQKLFRPCSSYSLGPPRSPKIIAAPSSSLTLNVHSSSLSFFRTIDYLLLDLSLIQINLRGLISCGRGELVPADLVSRSSDIGRTTIGEHHEEDSPSDGRHRRILCTLIRANAQDNRPGAAILLPGSGHREYEMSNRRDPARCWRQHEGCRRCSLDKGISRGGFEG